MVLGLTMINFWSLEVIYQGSPKLGQKLAPCLPAPRQPFSLLLQTIRSLNHAKQIISDARSFQEGETA